MTNDEIKAFPIPSYVNSIGETHDVQHQGMELRDYFAAKAMQSLITEFHNYEYDSPKERINNLVQSAYKIADGMMECRKTKL